MDVDRITQMRDEVERRFARTCDGQDLWPDPHTNVSPSDEEYSRATHPERWRIVGQRADAWLEVLSTFGLASIERDATIDWDEAPGTVVTRCDRAVPRAIGAVPLVVCRSRIDGVDDAGVTIGVGDPAVVDTWIPICGCDACDNGSQEVLETLDEHLMAIVTGQFRHLRRRSTTITSLPGSLHLVGIECEQAARALANPSGWNEVSGTSWFH